jgi:hypothetical protein
MLAKSSRLPFAEPEPETEPLAGAVGDVEVAAAGLALDGWVLAAAFSK